jgi:hypothetical protein
VRHWSQRDAALVQRRGHQRAGGPGRLERAQVAVVAHAAASIDGRAGQGARQLDHRVERRTGAAPNAGKVDHQRLSHRPRASGAAAPGSRPASCGSGDQPTGAQVDAEHERGAAGVEQAPDPSGRAGRLGAETVPGDPPARWGAAARSGVVAPASTHGSPIDASPVRMVSFIGPPASASRSATYTVGLCTPRTAPAPP